MLGKLMKYEFLAMARSIVPAYIAVILFAMLSRASFSLGQGGAGLFAFLYPLSIAVVFVMTFLIIIRRFYLNTFKDEGYLTHTIPISTDVLIWGKLLPAVAWVMAGVLVVALSALFYFDILREFWSALYMMPPELPFWAIEIGLELILGLLNLILGLFVTVLSFYNALCIGQLVNRAKILIAILVFFGFNIAFSTTSYVLGRVFYAFGATSRFSPSPLFNMTFNPGLDFVLTLLQGVTYYLITRWILRNRLNLE